METMLPQIQDVMSGRKNDMAGPHTEACLGGKSDISDAWDQRGRSGNKWDRAASGHI